MKSYRTSSKFFLSIIPEDVNRNLLLLGMLLLLMKRLEKINSNYRRFLVPTPILFDQLGTSVLPYLQFQGDLRKRKKEIFLPSVIISAY